MIFLSPFLLSISSNLNILRIFSPYGIKKIHLTKSITLLLAIITSVGTFISMHIGKLTLHLFQQSIGNIFGAVLLGFIGVYFIVEYIRLEKKHIGYDTSYYFESSLKYKSILENPNLTKFDKSDHINVKGCLKISFAIILNNLWFWFAASITGISISLSIFFNFIITIASAYLGYFNSNIYILKWLSKYSNLVSGIILIILGIYESFI